MAALLTARNIAANPTIAKSPPGQGTPPAIVQKLHDATVATMNASAVRAKLDEMGVDLVAPERRSAEYLRDFVRSEIGKWAGPIKASGVNSD